MGKRIPAEIKNKVLDELLSGIQIDMIATSNRIGYGSVYRIMESFKSEIPDLDLLRAVAVLIKKEGMNLSFVASGIRIKNYLEKLEFSEIEMENILRQIDIYCYKTDQTIPDFVNELRNINKSL